jgi:TonB family protein
MATQPTDTTKSRLRTINDELTVIAQRAQAFTNASGTAVALSEGNADEIVCRARSGSAAPDVGAVLRVDGSFTGLCIQSGKELRCDDAETDTRVDTAAIRSLGIRSMVVTPIREDNRVTGVLACFAPSAHAFTITHVAVLKTMADQISVLLQKERRGREEGVELNEQLPAPRAAAPAPLPPPVVIKPAVSATAAAPAPARVTPAAKAEPIKSEVAAPVPFPKREEKQKAEVRPSFGTLDAVAEEKKSGSSKMLIGAVAVVVLAASSGVYLMKSRKPSTAVPVQHAQETTTQTLPPQTQTAAVLPAETTTAAANAALKPQPGSSANQPVPAVSAKNTSGAENNKKSDHSNTANPEKPIAAADQTEKRAPTPVAIASGPSRLSASAATATVELSPTLGMTTPSVALSNLARPDSSAAPSAVITQSDLQPMRVLKTVQPSYPAIARVRRLSDTVVVQVTVGKDGKVHNLQFMKGQPVFHDAALEAVKLWQFKPATLNGQPIEQTTQIKMDFKP